MFSRLSQEESTVFGATLRRFIECTFDAEECDPQVGLFKFPRYFDISMLLFVIFIIVHDNSLIIIVNLFFSIYQTVFYTTHVKEFTCMVARFLMV